MKLDICSVFSRSLGLLHRVDSTPAIFAVKAEMNEWSLGGNYSRPVTPNQPGQLRSYRSQWDDHIPDKTSGSRQLIVNVRAVTDSRSKPTFQQRSNEDVSRTSIPSATKKKKSSNGTSDPRFKKVLSASLHKDACVETELKNSRTSTPIVEEETPKPEVPSPKTEHQCGDSVQNKESSLKVMSDGDKASDHKQLIVPTENFVFDPIIDHLKEVDKLSFSPDIVFPKKSISDCTIRTKNTSYASDDLADEYLTRFPSATRVSKVHNWIKEQKPKAEKRRSVITVIGQTQGQPDISTTFQEIDQRKKLAKELDKHAFCKKLIVSDKDKVVNNLVGKINFLGVPGKGFSGGDRILGLNDFVYDCGNFNVKGYGDEEEKKPEWTSGMIDAGYAAEKNERLQDSGASSSKRSGRRRKSKRSSPISFWDVRGRMLQYLDHVSSQWLIYFMIVVSGFLCWSTFLALQQNNFLVLDWFPTKPKTVTWYEKVLNWIWEIFRPAGSYRRSSSWNVR